MNPLMLVVPPWVPVAKWAIGLLLFAAPYAGLWYYVPKLNEAKAEIVVLNKSVIVLESTVAALETIKVQSTAAAEAMRDARNKADTARIAAQIAAEVEAADRDYTIATLNARLQLPTTPENECEILKATIYFYTSGVRRSPAASYQGGDSVPSYASIMRDDHTVAAYQEHIRHPTRTLDEVIYLLRTDGEVQR